MRNKALCGLIVLLITFGCVAPSQAFSDNSPEAIAADAFVVRPFCFVATVLGSAIFVVTLPVAAISKSTETTAKALVTGPAKATFTRPLGKLSSLE
jgi:hypothetical protein